MTASPPPASQTISQKTLALALLLVSPLMILAFSLLLPPASEFLEIFLPAAHVPFNPYPVQGYLNPPWIALLLYPLTLIPQRVAEGTIAFLNLAVTLLLVFRCRGNRWSVLLVITSAPFLTLLINGNIDWLPMTAFLLPANWGLAVILSKPQDGILAGLVWFKRAKRRLLFLLPAAGLLLLSFLVWGWWVPQMFQSAGLTGGRLVGPWNISPFPWLVPVGLILLYYAWKREDELLAVTATLCLVPYFCGYSLVVFFAMLAARNPRAAALAWIILWIFNFVLRWIALRYYSG